MTKLPPGAYYARNATGYTWVKKSDGSWLLPEDLGYDETVGWSCIAFAEKWLKHDGEPLRLTPEQQRMILWINAVDPETLRFVFPLSALVRIKGAGKDMIQAIMCLFELVGNCRPYRNQNGYVDVQPARNPWVIVAATSLEQTANTSLYFRQLASDAMIEHFGIDFGKELTFTATGGRMESVTSNPRRIEGQRPSFQSGTEVGLWVNSNSGTAMFEAMERGAAKDPWCRVLVSSNAYAVGEESVLEKIHQDYEAIQDGRMVDTGVNYDSLSAPADTNPRDRESLRHGIDQARGDAWWLDVDRKLAVALSGRTSVESIMRFELNINAAADGAIYEAFDWDQNADESLRLNPGDIITLGLDVSLSDDSSALVAMRVEDRAAFLLHIQEKPLNAESWQVDIGRFDAEIARAFSTYKVVGWFSDVNPIQGYLDRWEQQYGDGLIARFQKDHPIRADMRGNQQRFTQAHESLVAAVQHGMLKHDGNRTLRRHALNAHIRMNRHGMSFGKESKHSIRKIDAYAALLLADMARSEYLVSNPKRKQRRPGRLVRLR